MPLDLTHFRMISIIRGGAAEEEMLYAILYLKIQIKPYFLT